jgi:hypothetical protein
VYPVLHMADPSASAASRLSRLPEALIAASLLHAAAAAARTSGDSTLRTSRRRPPGACGEGRVGGAILAATVIFKFIKRVGASARFARLARDNLPGTNGSIVTNEDGSCTAAPAPPL